MTVSAGYELGLPQGRFQNGMNPLHSLVVSGALPVAAISKNLHVGATLGIGEYANARYGVEYNNRGNYINTSIRYTSNVFQGGGQALYLFDLSNGVKPFVSAKAGYIGFFSNFLIDDPTDPDACRVLEHESIQADNTLYWGYGGGVRVAIGKGSGTQNYIELSAHKTHGREIGYVNVDRLQQMNKPMDLSEGAQPVNVNFVSAGTNSVHGHTLAEVFRNRVDFLQLRLAWVYQFSL